jgi:hypothetical protein
VVERVHRRGIQVHANHLMPPVRQNAGQNRTQLPQTSYGYVHFCLLNFLDRIAAVRGPETTLPRAPGLIPGTGSLGPRTRE